MGTSVRRAMGHVPRKGKCVTLFPVGDRFIAADKNLAYFPVITEHNTRKYIFGFGIAEIMLSSCHVRSVFVNVCATNVSRILYI